MKARPIKTKINKGMVCPTVLSGWYYGKKTYLWIGTDADHCIGTLSGQKLYRLAKAIVRQFEGDWNEQ